MTDEDDDGALLPTIDGRTAAEAGGTGGADAAADVDADAAGGATGADVGALAAKLLSLVGFNVAMWVSSACFTPENVASEKCIGQECNEKRQ